jgi:pilus assembly protein CpaE
MVRDRLAVMIVDADRSQRRSLRGHLEGHDKVEIMSESKRIDDCLGKVQNDPPDILIVHLDTSADPDKTLGVVESLKLAHPLLAVFVNSNSSEPELIMSAMRAGAQEFLQRPVEMDDLHRAIDKVRRLRSHTESKTVTRGEVVSVFSKRGGLGITTLAVNLGIALSEISEQRTALMDLDLQLGDVTSFLDLSPEYGILDACNDSDEVDKTTLQSCMTPHRSGVMILAEKGDSDEPSEVTGSQVKQILEHLRSIYRYVVVDTSHILNDSTSSAFEQSDHVLVVTVSTVSSIRATKRTLDMFRSKGYGPDKVHIVVNRVSKIDSIQVNEIEKTLNYPVFWTIPNNYKVVIDAINSGVPLVNGKRMSNVGKSVMQLAELLTNGARRES